MPILSIDIEARLAKFQDGLDKMVRNTSRSAQQMERAFGGVANAIKLIGAGWIAREIGRSFKQVLDLQDSFAKLSQQTGISVEALSAYDYVARLSGVSTEEMTKAIVKLNEQLVAAKTNASGREFRTLNALGIDPKQISDAEQLLQAVAQRFSEFRDGSEKTAFAVALFGERIGPKLIPFLNTGASGFKELREEAERLGLILSGDAARAAEQFNDNLERLSLNVSALARNLFNDLIPGLNALVQRFLDARMEGLGFIDSFDIAAGIDGLYSLDNKIADIQRRLNAASSGTWTGWFFNDVKKLQAELDKLLAVKQRFLARETEGVESWVDFGAFKPFAKPPKPPGTGTGAKERESDFERYMKQLQDQIAKLNELNTLETLYYDLEKGRLGKVTDGQLAKVAAIAKEIDERTKLKRLQDEQKAAEEFFADAETGYAQRLHDSAEAIRDLIDPTRKYLRELERIRELHEGGLLADPEASKALADVQRRWTEEIHGANTALDEQKDIAQELGLTFSSAFEDAIVGGRGLRDIIRGIEQDIIRLVTRQLVTKPFASWLDTALPLLLSGFGGAAPISASVPTTVIPRAMGGPVTANRPYLVGERAPELFVPKVSGDIVPLGGMGSTVNMYVTTADAESFRRSEGQIANRLSGALARGGRFR